MRVRRQQPNVSFIIQELIIKLVKFMKEQLLWTGWFKNRKEVLQSLLLLLQPIGNIKRRNTKSILLILQDTLTLQLRLKDLYVYWMARSHYSAQLVVSSHNQKRYGDKLINIRS